jgi:multidrug resistance protein MdtO
VFVLPHLDSITGFTIFFMLVIALASWFITSSPRLSYFGFQIVVIFCLINLQEFARQTSLAAVRDRIAGVFLGLCMMWLVFDQLWGSSAAVEMKRVFISNLRLLAQFVREPLAEEGRPIERSHSLRENINANFDTTRASADGVLFEFGASRQQDLALRNRIRQWQPKLRALFVIRIALRKYRLQLPGFELPEGAHVAQQEFDDRIAQVLDAMATRMENGAPEERVHFEGLFERLKAGGRDLLCEWPRPIALGESAAVSYSVPYCRKYSDVPGKRDAVSELVRARDSGGKQKPPRLNQAE